VNIVRAGLALLIIFIFSIVFFSSPIQILSKKNKEAQKAQDIPKLYPYPTKSDLYEPATPISARSATVIDAKTGVVLYQKDADIAHLPASTAKLMTALVALEKCAPSQIITVGYVEREPTQMGLASGDVVTVENLLYGLLVASGNDAAYALSYSCAKNTFQFVEQMNLKAKELEMKNTHFQNPAGFDSPSQFTTARDLAKLAKVAVANPLISRIVATKEITVTNANNQKNYYLKNVNALLGTVKGVEGIKTGLTEGALQSLITKTKREGNTIITVVLGSEDRFLDSTALIDWAFANHRWQAP